MKHESQVVMLPTKDKTPLFKDGHEIIYYPAKNIEFTDVIYQHLYITVSQEVEHIKACDWYLAFNEVHQATPETINIILSANKKDKTTYIHSHFKIIATTDKLKIDNWVGHYNSDESYLPQIPQQFIKEYCNKGCIDKVDVEYKHSCYIRDSLHNGFKGEWNEISIKAYEYSITNPESLHHNYKEYKEEVKLKLNPDNTLIIYPLEKKTPTPFQQSVLDSLDTEMLAEILAYKSSKDSLKGKITEEHFRNFIRANHLTAQWDKWIKDNL